MSMLLPAARHIHWNSNLRMFCAAFVRPAPCRATRRSESRFSALLLVGLARWSKRRNYGVTLRPHSSPQHTPLRPPHGQHGFSPCFSRPGTPEETRKSKRACGNGAARGTIQPIFSLAPTGEALADRRTIRLGPLLSHSNPCSSTRVALPHLMHPRPRDCSLQLRNTRNSRLRGQPSVDGTIMDRVPLNQRGQ